MLDFIQDELETIYGIRCAYRAKDFLVDAETARELGGSLRSREELLVSETSEGFELALYIEPELLARVSSCSPLEGDLGDFCEVAEGVSHFLYLEQSAQLERRVSLLELEAQAEVDKFALCTLLRWRKNVGSWGTTLVGRLFERIQFRDGLSVAERWRYFEANRLAKLFCSRLLPMVRKQQREEFLSALRYSYRLGSEAKLRYFSVANS
jgi:hypothetical protein